MRIGVFGGSFDPVHIGHLIVAEAAADGLRLDQVRFIPTREHPFKGTKQHATGTHRVEMLRIALAGNPRFVLDRQEMARPGPSYTVDTLCALRDAFSDDRLFLLIGADAAAELAAWHHSERLAELATVTVLTRPGALRPDHPVVTEVVTVPAIGVSATAIRAARQEGRSIRYQVPDAVAAYIDTHGLYLENADAQEPR